MNLSGTETIAAPPAAVWAALIDPDVLRPLIPGCEAMRGSPATGYDIVAARKVASTELRLTGRVDLLNARPGEGGDLAARGSAGAAGGAHGTARIRLAPLGAGTRLSWDIDAEVEGAIARFPDFVIRMAAGKVAEGFLRRFKAAVEGSPPPRRGFLGRLAG